jgi:hypothetical protein
MVLEGGQASSTWCARSSAAQIIPGFKMRFRLRHDSNPATITTTMANESCEVCYRLHLPS